MLPKKTIFIGLLLLGLSIIIYQFLFEAIWYIPTTGKKQRDVIELLLVLLIGGIGFIGLYKIETKWATKLWLSTYAAVSLFLLLALIIDWYVYSYSLIRRYRFWTIKEFFIGPFPYAVTLLLIWVSKKLKIYN